MSAKRDVLPRVAGAGAFLLVLYVYTFFGSIGTLEFHRIRWDQGFGKPAEGYYASLAEGFLRGQLHMAHKPDPGLLALPNPYDYQARHDKVPYLWDASYLNGKYYLYFSPLPALLIHIPFRLLAGSYPHDQLVGLLFATWAFVMSVLFFRRALAGRRPHVPMPIWIIAHGLAGVMPFVITHCRTYEIAILCGAAMTATWAYALLRFLETPTLRRLLWASIWLALAIAARPHLSVLVLVLFAAIAMTMKRELRKAALIALLPLAVVGTALMIYNHARFHDPFEFGTRYQLTYMQMSEQHVCGVRSPAELLRLVNNASIYTFTAPSFHGRFPFVDLHGSPLDPAVCFTDVSDQTGGLAPLAPLAMLGSLLAPMLTARRGEKEAGLRAALLSVAAGWLALLGVGTCWFASARYELDFWFLISAGAIVCVEATLTLLAQAGVRVRPLAIAMIVVALCTSLLGSMLGFRGTVGAFPYFNPELYERLGRFFG